MTLKEKVAAPALHRRGPFKDIHGTIWQEGDPLHLVEPVLKAPSLKGFEIPSYAPFLRREVGRGGGYVCTSSKPIMREVPVANAVALIDETVSGED